MTRTKITITGLALAVTLLISAQTRADMVTFEFTTASENYAEVADYLSLTATNRTDGKGVDFVFTSDWTGGDSSVNGGRGNIWNLPNSGNNPGIVYFANHNYGKDVFYTGGDFGDPPFNVGMGNPFSVDAGNFDALNQWKVEFNLFYANTTEGSWEGFVDALNRENNPLLFRVYINGLSFDGDGALFDGTAVPEPATLAVLGLGLAGVGLVSRRRRK